MGSGQLHESRSYSTSDLLMKTSIDQSNNGNAVITGTNQIFKRNRARKPANINQQESGILKRCAQRFYHSLPHHYKLPILNPRVLLEETTKEETILNDYSDKLTVVVDWFREFNDEQKNQMLASLFNECQQPQNHLLSMLLQDKLHISCPPNCQDFLLWLPPVLAYKILSYCDPISLARCSQVCRYWQTLANTQFLWQKMSLKRTWRLSHAGHQKQMNLILEHKNRICWKKVTLNIQFLLKNIEMMLFYHRSGVCGTIPTPPELAAGTMPRPNV